MTAMSRIADEAIAAAAEVPRFEDGSINLREVIRQLAELFGEDRLLFATDYPFDGVTTSIRACEEAFRDDPIAADKVFYRNSARLLGL